MTLNYIITKQQLNRNKSFYRVGQFRDIFIIVQTVLVLIW